MYQGVRAEGVVWLHLLELVEVLLHGDVDLSGQLMLQYGPGWLKGHVPRLYITQPGVWSLLTRQCQVEPKQLCMCSLLSVQFLLGRSADHGYDPQVALVLAIDCTLPQASRRPCHAHGMSM